MNRAFENAARYAEEFGFKVFPCAAGGKTPLLKHGFHEATSDAVQLSKWNKKWPDANWAVATGSESGVFVADIDSAETEAWWESLWIPEGAVISTPRGGKHIYYAYDGDGLDLGITNGSIHKSFDTRGNGGYVLLPGSWTSPTVNPSYGDGAYEGELDAMIEVPQGLIDLIPEKQYYETLADDAFQALSEAEKPSEVSPAEQRVLKGLTDLLDRLPRPWSAGAGWHSMGFYVACQLHRISSSPDYATTEAEAYRLYKAHVPIRREDPADIWDIRWASAKKQTQGQIAEHPGDTPIRLDAIEILDNIKDQAVHSLFWESKKIGDVKRLIHELRMQGATEQEAYSVSYESAAMKNIRKANSGSSSTWGYVVKEYDTPIVDKVDEKVDADWGKAQEKSDAGYPLRLISDDERQRIRDYPNFIDQYIMAARKIYDEPNMPIHYVNSWSALSAAIGDKGKIYLDRGVVPLNMWSLKLAPSAAGKSDANKFHSDVVDVIRPGGWNDVYLGSDASAEALSDILMERDQRTSMMARDEAHSFLEASSRPGGYEYKTRQLYLELYDGNVSRAVRKGMDRDRVGERAWTNFILSLQGTWAKVTEAMNEGDIESGFIGRFLVAVGDEAKITRESLTLKFASEYQVSNGGRNPLIDHFCDPVRAMTHDMPRGQAIEPANAEVNNRLTDIRMALRDFAERHPLADHLRGVLLRIGVNIAKGAALVALSEGRTRFEMEDLLLAAKSGEHWLKSSILLAEAVSSSEYRRLVEYVAEQVAIRPRSEGTLMKLPRLKNMKMFEAAEIIQRAAKEGLIEFDPASKKYREVEES